MEQTPAKKPKRSPTPRQRKAAQAIVENLLSKKPLPTGQVLESVGYSPQQAEMPNRIVLSDGVQNALADTGLKSALLRQGINPDKIAEKIGVLLHATKPIQKFSHETGETELLGETPDYQAIDKGIAHATKIYGILDDTPKSQSTTTYNFIFSDEVRERVKVIDAEIKDMLTKPHVQEN